MTHGEELVRPFTTCQQPGVQHAIIMQGDEPWLCWLSANGDWVTECKVGGPGLGWRGKDKYEIQEEYTGRRRRLGAAPTEGKG